MFEEFKKVIAPQSLLELVPREVLLRQMQGFFFGERAGMVLIYDETNPSTSQRTWHRLEPLDQDREQWRKRFENFNPFCALFRSDQKRDAMCEACDLARVESVYANTEARTRYDCHMKLIDMTFPLRVDGNVRGVLFGGQRIQDSESSKARIQAQVAAKAPELASQLVPLIDQTAVPDEELLRFEEAFLKFARELQLTITTFAAQKRQNCERAALLEISEELEQAPADDWERFEQTFRNVLGEIKDVLGRPKMWLLLRRSSRYETFATAIQDSMTTPITIPVASIFRSSNAEFSTFRAGQALHNELAGRLGLGLQSFTVVRSDSSVTSNDVASVLLVVEGMLSDEKKRFVSECVRHFSHPAGVLLLIRRLEKQQSDFAHTASFTGHHLKTPLQAARLDIAEARLLLRDDPEFTPDVLDILSDADQQIEQGMADALRLQSSASNYTRENIDIGRFLEELASSFESIARRRNNVLRVFCAPADSRFMISGVPFQLRIAFSNMFDNAIKYSFEDKAVEVRVSRVVPSGAGARRMRSMISVEIENYGVGFAAEEKSKLFNMGSRLYQPVRRVSRPGEGIGLAQAKTFIEGNGGSLDIHSETLSAKSERSGGISRVIVTCHLPQI